MPSSNTFAQTVSPKLSPQPSFIDDESEKNKRINRFLEDHLGTIPPSAKVENLKKSGFLDFMQKNEINLMLQQDFNINNRRLSVSQGGEGEDGWLLKNKSNSMNKMFPPGPVLGQIDLKDEDGRLPYEKLIYDREIKDLNEKNNIKSKWRKGGRVDQDKVIGFYNLCGEIGAGNFSKVKLGIHHLTRVKVAVKIIEKSRIEQRMEKMLAREIINMESLSHPNIIRLYEVIETPEKLFLISELAPGGDLYSMTKLKEKLSETQAKPIFRQILSAVSFMHANGIIHRDLKCENIFFATQTVIKVGDLGFSIKSTKGQMLRTFCGSPPYAAPELYKDSSYEGEAVDIWALGVILYFMVAGCFPFHGSSIPILKQAILTGVYEIPEKASDSFIHLCQLILQQLPIRRISISEIIAHPWLKGICTIENNGKIIPMVQNRFYMENKLLPNIPTEDHVKNNLISYDESKSFKILREIGVSEDVLKIHRELGIKSHVTGIYRILLHKSQNGYRWEGKDFIANKPANTGTRKFLTTSKSHENFFSSRNHQQKTNNNNNNKHTTNLNSTSEGGRRRAGSTSINVGESVKSSACTIL